MPASPESMPSSRRIRAVSAAPTSRPPASSLSSPPQPGRRTPAPFRVAPPWSGAHAVSSPFASPPPTESWRLPYGRNAAPSSPSLSRWRADCELRRWRRSEFAPSIAPPSVPYSRKRGRRRYAALPSPAPFPLSTPPSMRSLSPLLIRSVLLSFFRTPLPTSSGGRTPPPRNGSSPPWVSSSASIGGCTVNGDAAGGAAAFRPVSPSPSDIASRGGP